MDWKLSIRRNVDVYLFKLHTATDIHTYIGTFGWTRKNAIINDTPRTCTCFETKRKSSSASKTTWRSIATCGSTRRKPIPFHRISSPSSCWPIITMSSHMLSIDIFQSLAMFIIPYNFSIPASSTNQSRPVPSHIPSHWHRVRPQGMCQPIITFNPSPLPRNYLITLFYIIRQFGCTDRSIWWVFHAMQRQLSRSTRTFGCSTRKCLLMLTLCGC